METKNGLAVFHDDDYVPLDSLSLTLEEESIGESGSVTICFWIYLLKSSKPGFIIRQGRQEGPAAVPFLVLNTDRKLVLHPSPSVGSKLDKSYREKLVVSDQVCPVEKWVHVGCEIGSPIARLHMVGTVVGERYMSACDVIEGITRRKERVYLFGGNGQSASSSLQGFIYYLRLLPQPTVTNHYVKNPPLELLLDGPSGASEDYELEEGGDGVWSVVGGKASCRRNFALDVTLLDALGRSVHKEMELVAFLVFADTGLPVEKPKNDAEAPLLTTFDGVEFPSSERPIKLVHGRASFKLKISQLSSKCDNRLFRVCFESPSTQKFPFLRAFSRPIRCVSRNRNHRMPATHFKHPQAVSFPLEGSMSPGTEETIATEALHSIRETHCSDASPTRVVKDLCYLTGQFPSKRARAGLPNETQLLSVGQTFLHSPPDSRPALSGNEEVGTTLSSGLHLQKLVGHAAPVVSALNWPGTPTPLRVSARIARQPFLEGTVELGTKLEIFAEGNDHSTAMVTNDSIYSQRCNASVSDDLVFKYCLESMHGRGEFLKAFVMSRGGQELTKFANRVVQLTGCRHDGYQILIARNLLFTGNELWAKISQESFPPLWTNVLRHIDQSFMITSGSVKRSLSAKDKEFLKQLAGCGNFITREEFGRLWNWIYPVALAVRSTQLRSTWDSEDPRWIEGMISKEEVEGLLKSGAANAKPGTFLLRFAGSRVWPHPDSGALVVSYVGSDMTVNHKLLVLDDDPGFNTYVSPLSEQLLLQPELAELCRVCPDSTG